MMKKIGVIGLGIIGKAWAKNYAESGVLAGTWNRTPQADAPEGRASPEAVLAEADIIQIVVADPPAVAGILDRIVPHLRAGQAVVQSSTIDPASSKSFCARVRERGAVYVEAPFTGSKPAADARQTVYYLGGEPAAIAAVEPTLKLNAAHCFLIGTNEQACALKLAMNLNIVSQMEALAEALSLAREAGIADAIFFEAISRNASYSGVTKLKEPKLRAGDFSAQFSIKHMLKDMRLASQAPLGPRLPLLAAVRQRLEEAEKRGLAEEDFSALIKLLQ